MSDIYITTAAMIRRRDKNVLTCRDTDIMLCAMSHVVPLIEALAAASDRSPHTVGRWLSGDGMLYARLTATPPGDITSRRAERIIQAASDRWPL